MKPHESQLFVSLRLTFPAIVFRDEQPTTHHNHDQEVVGEQETNRNFSCHVLLSTARDFAQSNYIILMKLR